MPKGKTPHSDARMLDFEITLSGRRKKHLSLISANATWFPAGGKTFFPWKIRRQSFSHREPSIRFWFYSVSRCLRLVGKNALCCVYVFFFGSKVYNTLFSECSENLFANSVNHTLFGERVYFYFEYLKSSTFYLSAIVKLVKLTGVSRMYLKLFYMFYYIFFSLKL